MPGCLRSRWAMVHDLELNVFYDDGEGYIDLGLDNVYEFDVYAWVPAEPMVCWSANWRMHRL